MKDATRQQRLKEIPLTQFMFQPKHSLPRGCVMRIAPLPRHSPARQQAPEKPGL